MKLLESRLGRFYRPFRAFLILLIIATVPVVLFIGAAGLLTSSYNFCFMHLDSCENKTLQRAAVRVCVFTYDKDPFGDILEYLENVGGGSCADEGHSHAAVEIFRNDPVRKKYYYELLFNHILSDDSGHNYRVRLFRLLEEMTGRKFGYYMKPVAGNEYPGEEAMNKIDNGFVNINKWAEKNNLRCFVEWKRCGVKV